MKTSGTPEKAIKSLNNRPPTRENDQLSSISIHKDNDHTFNLDKSHIMDQANAKPK